METLHFQILLVVLLTISFLVAKKAGRRKKLGCVGFGYISLVVFLIGMFAVMITFFLTSSAINGIQTYTGGESYMATIVSYSSYESKDDDGRTTTMYTPTYEIDVDGKGTIRVDDYMSSGGVPNVGELVELYYNKETGNILRFSAGTIIMAVGMFIMWIVLAFCFAGILNYLFGGNMSKYFKIVQAVGMGFFIPLVMIAFEALLIYALFYGNDAPGWASAILVFFIIGLGLGIWGYLKMLFGKGLPKWQRTSDMSWSADWDEEGEDEEMEEVERDPKKPRAKKKMVPLNKDLLNKKKQ